ncbi:MAG: hypothetical protein ABJ327_02910 [Litoreibacter sp.]
MPTYVTMQGLVDLLNSGSPETDYVLKDSDDPYEGTYVINGAHFTEEVTVTAKSAFGAEVIG